MDTVMITGGAGFIGSWLVKRCLAASCRVVVYDDFSTGSRSNFGDVEADVEVCEYDVRDTDAVAGTLRRVRPDIIYHLAAIHFIPYCDAHPAETVSVNVTGTVSLLSAASDADIPRVVIASSGVVYPSVDCLLTEDLATSDLQDIYALSKSMAEQACKLFVQTKRLACVVARLFNTYGPNETNPHLIPHIIQSIRQADSVELGNTHTKRDFVYVEDVAEALFRLGQAETGYQVVNVGYGQEYSAEQIVGCLSRLLARPIRITSRDGRKRAIDKMHQRASTRKLEELINWRPQYGVAAGLQKTLASEGL